MTETDPKPRVGERIATIEERVRHIQKTVDKIESKIDRAHWLIVSTVVLAVIGTVIAGAV